MAPFEVLWYTGENEEDALLGSSSTKEFKTRKQALAFYEKHKNDPEKFAFWVTRRDNEYWDVIEDIIY